MLKYSVDFYLWMAFTSVPTFGFIYALLHKQSRPWVVKAIEDSDDKPHQVDLTFWMTLTAGWLLCYALFAGIGLRLFEGQDTLDFCVFITGIIALFWGLKPVVNKLLEELMASRQNNKQQ